MVVPPVEDSDYYAAWTDTQLVRQVATQAGAAGAGASAELTRRLMIQLRNAAALADKQNQQLARLTTWLLQLTVALLVLTGALVYKEFWG